MVKWGEMPLLMCRSPPLTCHNWKLLLVRATLVILAIISLTIIGLEWFFMICILGEQFLLTHLFNHTTEYRNMESISKIKISKMLHNLRYTEVFWKLFGEKFLDFIMELGINKILYYIVLCNGFKCQRKSYGKHWS